MSSQYSVSQSPNVVIQYVYVRNEITDTIRSGMICYIVSQHFESECRQTSFTCILRIRTLYKSRWVDGTPSPLSLSGRSLHLTLVTKWSRPHMTLKIQISRSWPRSNPLVTFEAQSSNRYVYFLFCGNRTTFGWAIANFMFYLENSRSRSRPRLNLMVTFEA